MMALEFYTITFQQALTLTKKKNTISFCIMKKPDKARKNGLPGNL